MKPVPDTLAPELQAQRTVVLVDDHAALRDATQLLLSQWGYVTRGGTADPERAERLICSTRPDLAIVDVRLGEVDGTALVRRLLTRMPDLHILVYTGLRDELALRQALACGATGFALKSSSTQELREAVNAVASGRPYLDAGLAPMVLSTPHAAVALSPREREILGLLAEGLTGAGAAQQLYLAGDTVRTHIRNAMSKLGAHTRTHAVVIACRDHLLGPGLPPDRS